MDISSVKVAPLDRKLGNEVRNYIDTLTKPPGSLGQLEKLAIHLAEIRSEKFPKVTPPGVIVFAADHGVTEEGVSAFPKEVTAQMVHNFLQNGAAINVFSKQIGALLAVVDIGVATDLNAANLIKKKVRYGTANFCKEDAMTRKEAEQALTVGMTEAEKLLQQGIKCLIVGEMGIGNTTVSSTILAALTGENVSSIVGIGTGIPLEKLKYKQSVIEKGLANRSFNPNDPLDVIAKVGGLEIAGMTGAMIAAARNRTPILLDGFICSVAALLAERIVPGCKDYMIAGHKSVEPGHQIVLNILEKKPLIDLDLRLGEGSGAAVAFPLLQSATVMINEMATFSSAQISK